MCAPQVLHNASQLCELSSSSKGAGEGDSRPQWDIVILDEGHKVEGRGCEGRGQG